MTQYWFTADTHFSHTNILRYCHRPFKNIEEHDYRLIQLWNSRVKPEDIVFHLGDFCFKEIQGKTAQYFLNQLNGKIIIIKGNHDSRGNGVKTCIQDIRIRLGGKNLLLIHRPEDVGYTDVDLVLCGHVHCYSADTELLTEEGWKLFKDLKEGEKVATLNLQTNELEYQLPTHYFKHHYCGPMLHFVGSKVDILCTPSTSLLAKDYWGKNFTFNSALHFYNYRQPIFKIGGVLWKGTSPKFFYLPQITDGHGKLIPRKRIPMEKWAKFLGWYLSEGYSERVNPRGRTWYRVRFTQYQEQKRKEISEIIKEIGFNPIDLPNQKQVAINSRQLWDYLRRFGKSGEKFVPKYIKEGSRKVLLAFWSSFLKGDGYFSKTHGRFIGVTTSSPRLRDDLMEIAVKLGLSPTMVKNRSWYKISFAKASPETSVRQKYLEFYNGLVYDITVPNHTLLIRRNGKCVWTSNSAWKFKRISTYNKTGKKVLFSVDFCNVGVDQWNYMPVTINEILREYNKWLRERKFISQRPKNKRKRKKN